MVAECTLKESAAINQILGKRWHKLSQAEQSKYYEMARKERQLHMQMYPGWTARDNYALNTKKKKRKKERILDAGMHNSHSNCSSHFWVGFYESDSLLRGRTEVRSVCGSEIFFMAILHIPIRCDGLICRRHSRPITPLFFFVSLSFSLCLSVWFLLLWNMDLVEALSAFGS